MIVILLSIVCAAVAKPTSQPGPSHVSNSLLETHLKPFKDVDEIEGLLYEIPEYEDPEITFFELYAMGIIPVLTVLEMVEDPEDSKEQGGTTYYEDFAVKKSLDDIIGRLQSARTKLEKGSGNILLDIEMSLPKLMELDHRFHTVAHPEPNMSILKISSSNRDESDSSEMVVTSTEIKPSSETPDFESKYDEKKIKTPLGDSLTTESNKSLPKLMELDHRFHTVAHPEPNTPILKISSSNRDESDLSEKVVTFTEIKPSSETPDFESKYDEKKIKTPLGDPLTTEYNKYQDIGKDTFPKKWTLKKSVAE